MIAYGGDWNPEQWPEETWAEDVRLMGEAGVTHVSLGIFSWSLLEPVEGTYEFGWLDRVMDLLAGGGVRVYLSTPTASPPPWFGHAYPEALPVDADGRRLWPGSRQAFCPSSPAYLEKALAVTERLGLRYRDHPALAMWHVHNEYGNHNAHCYCDASAAAFRTWLIGRYGTLDALNDAWGTAFWSQRYSDWEQILPPRITPSFTNPGQHLDFRRFSSDALLGLYRAERDLLRDLSPGIQATTNFMAGYHWDIDYRTFADEVDVVSNDQYLFGPDAHIDLAFAADLTRSIRRDRPWLLMEHSTSAVNWQGHNRAKEPGEMHRNSVQHLARGADAILFFQWRQSKAGAEKWHSAMLPHAGTDTKIWREVVALGDLLREAADVAGSSVEADVAILLDWPSIWAQDHPAQPTTELKPVEVIKSWHAALWRLGVTSDVVHPAGDLSRYRLVLVPSLYLVSDEGAANLERFVTGGGVALVGPYSGIVDEHDQVRLGGYPGAWRELLGVRVEEFFPLAAGETVALAGGGAGAVWSEVAHATTASVLDTYATATATATASVLDTYVPSGAPAWTRNEAGDGAAHYLSTLPDGAALARVLAAVCAEAGVPTTDLPGIELVRRAHPDGRSYLFAVNHTRAEATIEAKGTLLDGTEVNGPLTLPAGAVRIVRESR